MPCSRASCFVTVAAQYGTAGLRLKRHLIMLATVIADDLKPFWCILSGCRFFCTALSTPLRSHQIFLVKCILFPFSKKKRFFALNTDSFNVGHRNTSLIPSISGFVEYTTLPFWIRSSIGMQGLCVCLHRLPKRIEIVSPLQA